MTIQANSQSVEPIIDEPQILEFLRKNPDFFEHNSELLTELRLTHPSGSAISLIERQVTALREQNEQLKGKLLNLVQVARDNDRLNERMHNLILDLLKAKTLAALLDSLSEHLHNEFSTDAIAVHLTGINEARARETGARMLVQDDAFNNAFSAALDSGSPLCGRLNETQNQTLFNEQAAAVESAAVLPLGDAASLGLLAIGSRDPNRFFPGMGTHFLCHLGELMGQLLTEMDIQQ